MRAPIASVLVVDDSDDVRDATRLLLVEDDPDIRVATAEILSA